MGEETFFGKIFSLFIILLLGAVFFKWSVDTCIGLRPDTKILAFGTVPEGMCNSLKEWDSEARKNDFTIKAKTNFQVDETTAITGGNSATARTNMLMVKLLSPTLLFADVPKDIEATVFLFGLIVALSIILGMSWHLLAKLTYKDPIKAPSFRRRQTATIRIMPSFSERDRQDLEK